MNEIPVPSDADFGEKLWKIEQEAKARLREQADVIIDNIEKCRQETPPDFSNKRQEAAYYKQRAAEAHTALRFAAETIQVLKNLI